MGFPEMNHPEVLFHGVCFTYETARTVLLANLTLHFSPGWTGIVGANGAGKTTILQLATGGLTPQQGHVEAPDRALYCPQRTDDPPPLLDELLAATDGAAGDIRGRLGIRAEWQPRWQSLSHGERKRAQIAVALWRRPEVLAIDEPTNHIDAEARELLSTALHSYQGVGLLVSHDRELLDALCRQCVFVDPPEAIVRPGGVTEGAGQARADEEQARREREAARRERQRLEREVTTRREEAGRAHRRRSKRGLGKDNDARFKRNLARMSGKDGVGGKLLRQLDGRLSQAQEAQDRIKVKKIHELGIWLPEARSRRDTVLRETGGSLPLGGRRRLEFPDLVMRPADRVAVTGPNGSGKSTLIRHLVDRLNVPAERVTYMPQEIDQGTAQDILARARELPPDRLGQMMTVVSRLGSRPGRLLESAAPSPGEVRKLLLALGITRAPHLIIMDEPTNHLDLPSIECLEEALEECPCGLLLVSHDHRFLARLTRSSWRIAADDGVAHRDVMRLRTEDGAS